MSKNVEEADIIIVNTCGSNENYERQTCELLGDHFSKKRPDAKVVSVGCLNIINRELLEQRFKELNIIDDFEKLDELVEANRLDIEAAPEYGLTDAQIDRLRLTPERIEGIADALLEVSMLADPVGQVISSSVRPNGLDVQKVRVPLGVVFFIYESRPNVTADAAALCVKSGNAVILRGGKEAIHSSTAIAQIMSEAAAIVESSGAGVVDINFGCSVRKILKSGSGAALMRTPDLAEDLLKAVRCAIRVPRWG